MLRSKVSLQCAIDMCQSINEASPRRRASPADTYRFVLSCPTTTTATKILLLSMLRCVCVQSSIPKPTSLEVLRRSMQFQPRLHSKQRDSRTSTLRAVRAYLSWSASAFRVAALSPSTYLVTVFSCVVYYPPQYRTDIPQ